MEQTACLSVSGWLVSTVQLSGGSERYLNNCIALLLQYCQGKKRETRETEERGWVCEVWQRAGSSPRAGRKQHTRQTSAKEYGEDA